MYPKSRYAVDYENVAVFLFEYLEDMVVQVRNGSILATFSFRQGIESPFINPTY